MLGKQKCEMLKKIRVRIAEENEIPFETRECTHQGQCSGTCPRCESEMRYLENQLQKRMSMGKRVTLAAICAGMAFTVSGCDVADSIRSRFQPTSTPEIEVLEGEVAMPFPDDPEENKDETAPAGTEEPTAVVYDTSELRGGIPLPWDELSGMVP